MRGINLKLISGLLVDILLKLPRSQGNSCGSNGLLSNISNHVCVNIPTVVKRKCQNLPISTPQLLRAHVSVPLDIDFIHSHIHS